MVVEGVVVDGHSSQYPWADWLDGRVWFIRAFEDFTCLGESMSSQAHTWAKLSGRAVCTRLVGGGLLLQAYPIGSTWKPNLAAINEGKIRKAKENAR